MEILIQKAKKRDKGAYVELMKREGNDLYKIAYAILGNESDASDAMQETALCCWEKIHTLRKNKYFKTWLTRILINNCNQIIRHRKKMVVVENIQEETAISSEYNNTEWLQLIGRLTEKYRTVIFLYYGKCFKVKEIAQILAISESAVKNRLSCAREKLKVEYDICDIRKELE